MPRDVNDLSGSDLWEGQVEVIRESPKALLVDYEGNEEWIAKSQIHKDSDVQGEGDEGVLIIPTWLAEKLYWT